MAVHGGNFRRREGDTHDGCDYCGSLTPAEALRRMTTPGCKFSGTDKGGYKFYFTGEGGEFGKFYGEHLADLSADELAAWATASRRCLGVDWEYDPNAGPACYSPKVTSFYGWQTYGVIGPDGLPVFDDDAPKPPSEEWWREQRAKRPVG